MEDFTTTDESTGSETEAPVSLIKALVVNLGIPSGRLEEAVTFYKAAFGAEEVTQQEEGVLVAQAVEIMIAGATIFLSDLGEKIEPNQDTGIAFYVEVDDFDPAVQAAVAAGAVSRGGPVETKSEDVVIALVKLMDPFGYSWAIVRNTFHTPPPDAGDAVA